MSSGKRRPFFRAQCDKTKTPKVCIISRYEGNSQATPLQRASNAESDYMYVSRGYNGWIGIAVICQPHLTQDISLII